MCLVNVSQVVSLISEITFKPLTVNLFKTLNIKTGQILTLSIKIKGQITLKTGFARGPGRGDTCYLSNLDETLPD